MARQRRAGRRLSRLTRRAPTTPVDAYDDRVIDAGTGATRMLRALVFTAAAVALTAGGHVVGGGQAPVSGLAILALLAWPAALLASSRRVTAPALFVGIGAAQVVGHLLMTGLGHAASTSTSAVAACLSLNDHAVHTASSVCASSGPAGVAAMEGMPVMTSMAPSLTMVVSHLVSVTVLAFVLGRGEAVLWRVLDAVLPRLPHPVAPPAATRRGLVSSVSLRLHRHLLLLDPRRGPPLGAL